MTPSELYDLPKSKGSANLVQKVSSTCFKDDPLVLAHLEEFLLIRVSQVTHYHAPQILALQRVMLEFAS